MYYIVLNTKYESIDRIANRVRKGGHNIPPDDVIRRFEGRFISLVPAGFQGSRSKKLPISMSSWYNRESLEPVQYLLKIIRIKAIENI